MFIPRGTLLNAATVLIGGLIGWAIGANFHHDYQVIAMHGLGIITLGLGLKMFLGSKNIVVIALAIALGGMLGLALGIQDAIGSFASWIERVLNLRDDAHFVSTVIGTSVLFCVGPMTLLGCMQDRLEKKIDLLAVKSTMDGIVAIFFGAVSGPAMIVVAVLVLVIQTGLTYAAKFLHPFAEDQDLLADFSATGGVMLVAIGLNLLEIKALPVANYLPALIIAPLCVFIGRKYARKA